ncbi:type VI immunity family protein [Archangium sp.]|jgi:hypothetical protein|uniref:type VI immunity family protein n=1 Tax=Archangium sp. TaxID=1872627 RepID=UPI002EDB51CE
MAEHYPRIRHYWTGPEERHLFVREALRITFYLPGSHKEVAPAVEQALEVYLREIEVGPQTLCMWLDHEGDWFTLDESGWDIVRSRLRVGEMKDAHTFEAEALQGMRKRGFESSVHLSGGTTDISGYEFLYVARSPWPLFPEEVSMVSFSLPTEYLEEHGPGRVRELSMELASGLPFASGHAGLAFHLPDMFQPTLSAIHDDCFRYPGVDVPDPGIRLSLGTRLKGVHWLNFLGPSVLGEMGGVAGLRARLHSPEATVQELGGARAVVSLGTWPEAGDLSRNHELPAYRGLARVLEPWLYEYEGPKRWSNLPNRDRWSGFTDEDMRRWWRRFLD